MGNNNHYIHYLYTILTIHTFLHNFISHGHTGSSGSCLTSNGSVDVVVFGGTIGAILTVTVVILFVLVLVALVTVSKYRSSQKERKEANQQGN